MNDVLPAILSFVALAVYGTFGFFFRRFIKQWDTMKKDVEDIKQRLSIIQSKATRIQRKVENGDDH